MKVLNGSMALPLRVRIGRAKAPSLGAAWHQDRKLWRQSEMMEPQPGAQGHCWEVLEAALKSFIEEGCWVAEEPERWLEEAVRQVERAVAPHPRVGAGGIPTPADEVMMTEAREADWWWTFPIGLKTGAKGDVFAGGGQVGRGAQLATVEGYRREAFGARDVVGKGGRCEVLFEGGHEAATPRAVFTSLPCPTVTRLRRACTPLRRLRRDGEEASRKRRRSGVALDLLGSFIATHDNSIPKRCTKIFKDHERCERGKNS